MAAATPRVKVETVGKSDEDRELVVVWVSSDANINNPQQNKENLANIAVNVGLDRGKVETLLNSTTGVAEVALAESELQRMGISGVPFYIINDKYGISGAQPPEAFVNAFRNVASEVSEQGEACDVEKKNC